MSYEGGYECRECGRLSSQKYPDGLCVGCHEELEKAGREADNAHDADTDLALVRQLEDDDPEVAAALRYWILRAETLEHECRTLHNRLGETRGGKRIA